MKNPSDLLNDLLTFAQTRTAIVPVGMILGGLLGLAVGARSQKDAVGLVVGLSLGYGAADKLACSIGSPVEEPTDPQVPQIHASIPLQRNGPVVPPGGPTVSPLPAKPAASPPNAA